MAGRRGRPLRAQTKLADLIRRDGRAAYVIATEAGLQLHQLNAYYTGRKVPSPIHLRRLCAALSCDPDDILEGRVAPEL